jgi:hypothetical protein
MAKSELREALRQRNVRLNQAAEALFEDRRFTTLDRPEVIGIAAFSAADLGFEGGATYRQLTARAFESGWVECPLELGPHLRMQYLGQPEGGQGTPTAPGRAPAGSITIASAPLDGGDATAKGFYLRRVDGDLWLRGYWSGTDHIWRPQDVLVFARARAT